MKSVLGLGGVFVALVLVGFFATRQWQALQAGYEVLPVDAACDLTAGPCSAPLPGGGEVVLTISPHPIPLMKPLSVDVRTRGTGLHPLHLDVTGVNMDMGLNRATFSQAGARHWVGRAILPVCSRRVMYWQADLALSGADRLYRLRYRFYTQH